MSLEVCQLSPVTNSASPATTPAGPYLAAVEATSRQQAPSSSQARAMTNFDLAQQRTSGGGGGSTSTTMNPPAPARPPKPAPPPRRHPPTASSSSHPTTTAQNTPKPNPMPPQVASQPKTGTQQPQPVTTSTSNYQSPPPPTTYSTTSQTPPSDPAGTTTGSLSHCSTSGSNTPPVQRWARSFEHLISDPEGLSLFRLFLEQETASTDLIDFYYSCESMRCAENRLLLPRLARAIIKGYVISARSTIHLELSDSVKEHLIGVYAQLNAQKDKASGASASFTDAFYMALFDDAQREIHTKLSGPYFANFIRHDIYLRHLSDTTYAYGGNEQATVYSEAPNAEMTPSPSLIEAPLEFQQHAPPSYDSLEASSGSTDGSYDPYGTIDMSGYRANPKSDHFVLLPTLTEQDETSSNIDLNLKPSGAENYEEEEEEEDEVSSTFGFPARATTADPTADYAVYFSDSGISGVSTTLSTLSLSRRRNNPLNPNRNSQQQQSQNPPASRQRSQSPIVGPSSASLGTRGPRHPSGGSSTGSHFIGDGISYNPDMMKSYHISKQAMRRGQPAPHPYHVSYSTRIPTSARDSEIASISSNSTSESYSLMTFQDRQLRSVNGRGAGPPVAGRSAGNTQLNVLRTALNQYSGKDQQQIGPPGPLGPKNTHTSKNPDPTTHPDQFAALLIKKLEEATTNYKVISKMKEIQIESDSGSSAVVPIGAPGAPGAGAGAEPPGGAHSGAGGSRGATGQAPKQDYHISLRNAIVNKQFDEFYKPTQDQDDQAILEKHCAQVWDKTPSNSGTPTTAGHQEVAPPVQQSSRPTYHHQHQHHHQHHQGPSGLYPTVQQPVHGGNFGGGGKLRPLPGGGGAHGLPGPIPGPYPDSRIPLSGLYPGRASLPPPSPSSLSTSQSFAYPSLPYTRTQPPPSIPVTVKFSDEDVPYKLNMVGPRITLAAFKQATPVKRGKSFRYFFRRKANKSELVEDPNQEWVQELIEEPDAVLPLVEGKIFATAHQL